MNSNFNVINKIKNLFNVMFIVWGAIIISFTPIEIIPQYKFLLRNGVTSLNFGFLFFLIVILNIIANQFKFIYFKLFTEVLYSLPLILLFLATLANIPPTIGSVAYLFLAIIAIMIMAFDDIKRN